MPGNRFNDGKCERQGPSLGSYADGERAYWSLYLFDPDCPVSLPDGVGISNGIAGAPIIVIIISIAVDRVNAFDLISRRARFPGRRVAFDVPRSMAFPTA